ncbi:hypothetical protein TMatcc_001848 [Talaromyces marneffei ATCC 18224]
MCCLILGKLDI